MNPPSQSGLQAETEARLRFEMLLADVCAKFVNVAPHDVDSQIEQAQRVICESLHVDHSTLWQVSEDDSGLFALTHTYRDSRLTPLPLDPSLKQYFPWAYSKILNKEIICIPNTATLPPEAAKDKESWEQYGIHSTLVFPLCLGSGSIIGILAFDCLEERDWSEPIRRRLQILSHVFAQAVDRKNAEQRVKTAQEALRASEERLRLAQEIARIGTFERDVRTGIVKWAAETEAMYGLPRGGFDGTTMMVFENLIHPDDRERVMGLTNEAIKTGRPTKAEWRVIWPNGSVHWIAGWWQVFMDESGKPWRMIGVNSDITERKQMEEALSTMSRKLIASQEQERARIGRELHDDITQRLAMLNVELGQLEENPSEIQARVQELRKRVTQLSSDVHALSHDLHSSKLEYLGVVTGMKSWCKESAERQKMHIEFKSEVTSVLPLEVGRTLFRVLQEALQNAAKHSGVKRLEVQVREESGEIHLIVSDSGKGFDMETAAHGKGLGLTSMRERVRLLNGTITIESKPMSGTTIHVRVPIESRSGAQRAAG